MNVPQKINLAGLQLIKNCESLRLDAYVCPAGKLTIGYGHTGDVQAGQKITEHQADVILASDLERFEIAVEQLAPGSNSNQFSALVSFAFNVGVGALESSTLLKRFEEGNFNAAAAEFAKWTHTAGVVLSGLVKRRAAEAALFCTPVS